MSDNIDDKVDEHSHGTNTSLLLLVLLLLLLVANDDLTLRDDALDNRASLEGTYKMATRIQKRTQNKMHPGP